MRLLEAVERVKTLIPEGEPTTIPEIAATGLLAPDLVVDALFLLQSEGYVKAGAISTGNGGHEILFRRTPSV